MEVKRMSQGDVIDYLKVCKEPKSAREIADATDTGKSTINQNLKRLRHTDSRIKWTGGKVKRNNTTINKYYIRE